MGSKKVGVGRDDINIMNGGSGIDELHDDLLGIIVSKMSLKESARASAVARRWRYFWMSKTTLRFDHPDSRKDKLEAMVYSVLHRFDARPIEALVVSLESLRRGQIRTRISNRTAAAIDDVVSFAMRKETVHLLELNLSLQDTYQFPRLIVALGAGVTSTSQLRTLRLSHCDIEDEVVHYILATCCPYLEELCIDHSYDIVNLRIMDPPRLKVLRISRCERLRTLEISALNPVNISVEHLKRPSHRFDQRRCSLGLKKILRLRHFNVYGNFNVFSLIKEYQEWSYPAVKPEKLVLNYQFTRDWDVVASCPYLLPGLWSLKWLELQVCLEEGEGGGRGTLYRVSLLKPSPQSCHHFRIEVDCRVYTYNLDKVKEDNNEEKGGCPKVIEGCLNEETLLLLALFEMCWLLMERRRSSMLSSNSNKAQAQAQAPPKYTATATTTCTPYAAATRDQATRLAKRVLSQLSI